MHLSLKDLHAAAWPTVMSGWWSRPPQANALPDAHAHGRPVDDGLWVNVHAEHGVIAGLYTAAGLPSAGGLPSTVLIRSIGSSGTGHVCHAHNPERTGYLGVGSS